MQHEACRAGGLEGAGRRGSLPRMLEMDEQQKGLNNILYITLHLICQSS